MWTVQNLFNILGHAKRQRGTHALHASNIQQRNEEKNLSPQGP